MSLQDEEFILFYILIYYSYLTYSGQSGRVMRACRWNLFFSTPIERSKSVIES